MSCYHHLTIEEREKLYGFLQKSYSIRKIAKELGRSPSTISRELRRNEEYLPIHAQERYLTKRKNCVRKCLLADRRLATQINFFLGRFYWSPEQISNRLKQEGMKMVSTSTIYRALDRGLLRDTLRYYLRFKYKKLGKIKTKKKRAKQKTIEERPREANDRAELGHWEGDTVWCNLSKTVIVTLVDRKSRFLTAGRSSNKEAAAIRNIIVDLLQKTKRPVRSITFDQGSEFSESDAMERSLGTQVYYANPRAPWERPTNENTNGLLRQFIPKHSNIRDVPDDELNHFVALLNLRPRKCLNWSTPYEVFSEKVLHFS